MNYLISSNIFCDIDEEQLIGVLLKRLANFFFLTKDEEDLIRKYHVDVLKKIEYCFQNVDNKYFSADGRVFFASYHSGQYLIYLYFYSQIFAGLKHQLKDKFYYLNKILHSVDIYAEVELPAVFFFEHPLGLVLGRAKYGNNFFAMQGCTIGGNKGVYPIIGDNVKMYSNSKILGKSRIGNNVWISANTYIKDEDVPSDTIVFGQSPNLIFKDIKKQ
ncbi:hypothetical protein [Sphingobacterium ginsenosidimutans]|uniref:Serine acetyltransferase n=1 Tax=Sphingobacterium ginsenosidimutans TaxID=687845 RepID=A0ABP8A1W2_9SPHI